MKAAVVRAFGEPLVIKERPDPEPRQANTGYGTDGGYSEKMLARADFAQPVPEGVSAFDAAPLTCAGVCTIQIPIFDTVLNGTSVIGSIVNTRQNLAVLRGAVRARIVFDLGTGR
ncbi:hypothetical protein [Streptomyces lincolnensis]|uniref:hypothetical protein n=1 Tax=Streptomyces lincolnensis TaxID=1915 RepID=UPI0037D85C3F